MYNTSAVILMATGGASGGGYVCSQGLLYGIYAGLLIMHGVVNSFGGVAMFQGFMLEVDMRTERLHVKWFASVCHLLKIAPH